MPEPLSEAVRSSGRNLGQVQGVRAGSGDAAVVDVDQDQVVRFLANRSIISFHFGRDLSRCKSNTSQTQHAALTVHSLLSRMSMWCTQTYILQAKTTTGP